MEHLAGELREVAAATVLGPVPVGTAAEALVRAAAPDALAAALGPALRAARPIGKLRVEVDPPRV
jgi:hypothetical protein